MSTNSFIIKGWAVALVGIIFGLNNLEGSYLIYSSEYNFPIETVIILMIISLFWFTNAYFLQQERRYIYIYAETIKSIQPSNRSLILDMNYKHYVDPLDKTNQLRKNIWIGLCLIIWLLSVVALFLYFNNTFLKIICTIAISIIVSFIITYLIPSSSICRFWACLIGRTVISVYGILIILVLFINNAMFNSSAKVKVEKRECECVFQIKDN